MDRSDEDIDFCNVRNCPSDYFMCNSRRCIPQNQTCKRKFQITFEYQIRLEISIKIVQKLKIGDGEPHCDGGEDETICNCQSDKHFKCTTGPCIDKVYRCDAGISIFFK